jgi:hypothetical protein
MILAEKKPPILYRSPEPILTPELPQEKIGTVANVVFPTAIDRRTDLGQPDRYDVYYGMADNRIGVARLDVPEHLPPEKPAERAQGIAMSPHYDNSSPETRKSIPLTTTGSSPRA